jgi:hypothetical protein
MAAYETVKAADLKWIKEVFDPLLGKIKKIREQNR